MAEDIVGSLDHRIITWLWSKERPAGGVGAWLVKVMQIFYLAARNSYVRRVPFRANALTFVSLLGLVPALAISFSVAKGLGFSSSLKDLVINELTANQSQVLEYVFTYVENTSVGTLGAVGLLMLIVTLVFTLSNVEMEFNRIWGVSEARTWYRKFTDYLSVLILLPVVVLTGTGVWAGISSHAMVASMMEGTNQVFGSEYLAWFSGLVPYMVLMVLMCFMYLFVPNTRIPWISGLVAGLIASAMWWGVQKLYISFQIGVAKFNAIYGTFASLPLFLVWVQVSWTVVLFGAELSKAHYQCMNGIKPGDMGKSLSPGQREKASMRIMLLCAVRFMQGLPPLCVRAISRELGIPAVEVQTMVDILADNGYLSNSGEGDCWQPGRALSRIKAADVLTAVRGEGAGESFSVPEESLSRLLDQANLAYTGAVGEVTLQDLAEENSRPLSE